MPVAATHFHNESQTQNHSYVANKATMCFHILLLEIIERSSQCHLQTDKCARTALWVLSSQAYNYGYQMTLHLIHFSFLIFFWEIIWQALNLPP